MVASHLQVPSRHEGGQFICVRRCRPHNSVIYQLPNACANRLIERPPLLGRKLKAWVPHECGLRHLPDQADDDRGKCDDAGDSRKNRCDPDLAK